MLREDAKLTTLFGRDKAVEPGAPIFVPPGDHGTQLSAGSPVGLISPVRVMRISADP